MQINAIFLFHLSSALRSAYKITDTSKASEANTEILIAKIRKYHLMMVLHYTTIWYTWFAKSKGSICIYLYVFYAFLNWHIKFVALCGDTETKRAVHCVYRKQRYASIRKYCIYLHLMTSVYNLEIWNCCGFSLVWTHFAFQCSLSCPIILAADIFRLIFTQIFRVGEAICIMMVDCNLSKHLFVITASYRLSQQLFCSYVKSELYNTRRLHVDCAHIISVSATVAC